MKVLLVSEDRVDLWTSLLTMCGAAKVEQHKISNNSSGRFCLVHLQIFLNYVYFSHCSFTNFVPVLVDISAEGLDVVVSVSPIPVDVLKCAMATNTPVVSLEWLVQCVICGERLAYASQPEYHHDYSS